jgi:hypothetical protein
MSEHIVGLLDRLQQCLHLSLHLQNTEPNGTVGASSNSCIAFCSLQLVSVRAPYSGFSLLSSDQPFSSTHLAFVLASARRRALPLGHPATPCHLLPPAVLGRPPSSPPRHRGSSRIRGIARRPLPPDAYSSSLKPGRPGKSGRPPRAPPAPGGHLLLPCPASFALAEAAVSSLQVDICSPGGRCLLPRQQPPATSAPDPGVRGSSPLGRLKSGEWLPDSSCIH